MPVLDSLPDVLEQRCDCCGVATFLPNAQYGWVAFAADRKQWMGIRIERDADAPLGSGMSHDIDIVGATHADLGHMDHVPTRPHKQCCRRAGHTLVEQQAPHAASSGCTLSSRFRAANASA